MSKRPEYAHIVAWNSLLGGKPYYAEQQIREAKRQNAPTDALFEHVGPGGIRTGEWARFEGLKETNPYMCDRMVAYFQRREWGTP